MQRVKRFVARALQSNIIGGSIRTIAGNHIQYYGGVKVPVKDDTISNRMVAAAYFGLYEKSEAKMIMKHLREDLPTIELGASLGMISGLIGSRCGKMIIGIEPNRELAKYHERVMETNGVDHYTLIHSAYSATDSDLSFVRGSTNLHGRIDTSTIAQGEHVKGRSISTMLEEFHISDDFQVVCDIEGAEVELILCEEAVLRKCDRIIVEMHNTNYEGRNYSVNDVASLFEQSGFKKVDQRGHVAVFLNSSFRESQ